MTCTQRRFIASIIGRKRAPQMAYHGVYPVDPNPGGLVAQNLSSGPTLLRQHGVQTGRQSDHGVQTRRLPSTPLATTKHCRTPSTAGASASCHQNTPSIAHAKPLRQPAKACHGQGTDKHRHLPKETNCCSKSRLPIARRFIMTHDRTVHCPRRMQRQPQQRAAKDKSTVVHVVRLQ